MREDLLDIFERLVTLRQALGDTVFRQACHRARLSIAAVALESADQDSSVNGQLLQAYRVKRNKPRGVNHTITK